MQRAFQSTLFRNIIRPRPASSLPLIPTKFSVPSATTTHRDHGAAFANYRPFHAHTTLREAVPEPQVKKESIKDAPQNSSEQRPRQNRALWLGRFPAEVTEAAIEDYLINDCRILDQFYLKVQYHRGNQGFFGTAVVTFKAGKAALYAKKLIQNTPFEGKKLNCREWGAFNSPRPRLVSQDPTPRILVEHWGEGVSQRDFSGYIQNFEGVTEVQFSTSYGQNRAFVQFQTIEQAQLAKDVLSETVLSIEGGYPPTCYFAVPRQTRDVPDHPTRLFVGNLIPEISSEHLAELFGKLDGFQEVHIAHDKYSNTQLPYAFVHFDTSENTKAALAAAKSFPLIEGQWLDVKTSKIRPEESSEVSPANSSPAETRPESPSL